MEWLQTSEPGVLHTHLLPLVHALEWAAAIIDLFSIAIILLGATRFVVRWIAAEITDRPSDRMSAISAARMQLGRYILAGLELLIVSDIIHTALSLALGDLLFLGLLTAIRSLISYFLDREVRELKEELDR